MASIHEPYERLLEAGLVLAADLSRALGVLGRDGVSTDFITTGVTAEERAAIGHIPVGRGILGVLIDHARPLRLHDIAEDPRSVGLPPNHPPMRSFLGVPVKAGGRVYGNLYLTEKQGGEDFDAGTDPRSVQPIVAADAGPAVFIPLAVRGRTLRAAARHPRRPPARPGPAAPV